MAYLTIEIDQKVVAERELTDTVVVGRSLDCDLHVPSKFLSRRHLRIERLAEGWRAVDLESTNGSTIDGQMIAAHPLDDGDQIRVENVRLIFRDPPVVTDVSRDPAADRITEDEVVGTLDARYDDSVDELPEERTLEVPVEQEAPTPHPAPAHDAAPTAQEHSRDLWKMATSPTLMAAAQAALRPADKEDQRGSDSVWAKFQAHPRSKPVGIAVGLAASVAIVVCYLSIRGALSSPHYDVHPITVTPTHTPGRDPLADNPV
jgi:pSer/pThr/pTyr-binding forkhead associated (FHA) protein